MNRVVVLIFFFFVGYLSPSSVRAMGDMPPKKDHLSQKMLQVSETSQPPAASDVEEELPLPLEAAKALLKEEAFPPSKKVVYLSETDVLNIALKRNLDILIARYDSQIEALEFQKAKSVFDTFLTTEATYEWDELGRGSTFQGSRETTSQLNVGLEKTLPTGTILELDFENERVSSNSSFVTLKPSYDSRMKATVIQPLLKNQWGLLDRGEVQKVKLDISKVNQEVIDRILESTAQIQKDYWALVLAQEEEAIKIEALEKAEALLMVNLDKYDRGLVEEGDLHASYANVALRKSDLAVAKNKTASAMKTVKLGLNDFTGTVILPKDHFVAGQFHADLEESLVRAFEHRHDYQKARLEVQKDNLEIRLKKNEKWPQLDLEASLTANGIRMHFEDAAEELARGNQRDYFMGFSFEFPIENQEANANYRQAKLKKLQSLLELQKIERSIFHEVDQQYRSVNVLSEKVRYTKEAEFFQKQKLEQEEKNFAMGRSNVNTLVTFQQDLLEAKMQSVQALYEYYEANVNLALAEATVLTPYMDISL